MNNQWKGKKWYCYGTSMTDNVSLINGGVHCGNYSKYLAEFAGLEEHNFGKGGSGIMPQKHGVEDSVKGRCMRLSDGKEEADLITVEVIPNDMSFELGNVTDTSDDTFCGNLNQIIEYLLTNTKAVVVILIASRSRWHYQDYSIKYPPTCENTKKWLMWEDAVNTVCRMHGIQCFNGASEAGLGFYRVNKDNSLVQDQIHLTDEGGKVLAKYYWGRLKNLYPND